MTVADAIEWGTDILKRYDIEFSRKDSEIIMLKVLRTTLLKLYLYPYKNLDDAAFMEFTSLIKRRIKHEPISYILGRREFMGFEFKVDSRCLIPRPETELIVEKCIKLMSRKKRPDVLDIGTGSGNIAVSIAKNIPDSRVAALDISEDALVLARENAAYHKADVSFLNSDLFESIPEGSIFDLIVSNPPYIAKEEMIRLPNEVKDFEPLISLNGGERGTEFYSRIVKDASRYLKPEGFLVLEIGWNQLEIIKEFIKKSGYLVLYNAEKDHAGFDRIITARKVTTNG